MEIAQESKQIRDLKTENLELKACLDEHQTALDIIMNKYREHMRQFMMTKKLEDNILKVLEANNVCIPSNACFETQTLANLQALLNKQN